jgi:hypothetical protein
MATPILSNDTRIFGAATVIPAVPHVAVVDALVIFATRFAGPLETPVTVKSAGDELTAVGETVAMLVSSVENVTLSAASSGTIVALVVDVPPCATVTDAGLNVTFTALTLTVLSEVAIDVIPRLSVTVSVIL